jgi:hypothetical protein
MKNRLKLLFAGRNEEFSRVSVNVYGCVRCDRAHYEDEDIYQQHLAHASDGGGIYEVSIEDRINAIFCSVSGKQ